MGGALLVGALIAVSLSAASMAAAAKLELTGNGVKVPPFSGARVLNETQFPGFTCNGSHETTFGSDPALALKFSTGEGGGEGPGYFACKYANGEEEEPGETFHSKLKGVIIKEGMVKEYYLPGARFSDPEMGCIWGLSRLSGPLPPSGNLEGVALTGTVTLHGRLFAGGSCARTASVTSTLTIEPGETSPAKPPLVVETVG
jgi:hypothetical protein